MSASRRLAGLTGAFVLLLAAQAPAGEVCDPTQPGSVSLIIVSSPSKVYELARSVARGVPAVVQDTPTVVFQDGRVITSDVENAGAHLNQLGWGGLRIDVVASFGGRRARRVGGG